MSAVDDLSPKARELLDAGCAGRHSKPVDLRSETEKYFRELEELRSVGFLRWVGGWPMITGEGRAAIGAPSEAELDGQYAKSLQLPRRPVPSRRNTEKIVLALVLVPERETPDSWFASCDGDTSKAVAIPKSQICEFYVKQFGFCLAVMPAWIAIDRKMSQANRPGLTRSVKWTPEQRAEWRHVQVCIKNIRHRLEQQQRYARNHPTYHKMPFGYTA